MSLEQYLAGRVRDRHSRPHSAKSSTANFANLIGMEGTNLDGGSWMIENQDCPFSESVSRYGTWKSRPFGNQSQIDTGKLGQLESYIHAEHDPEESITLDEFEFQIEKPKKLEVPIENIALIKEGYLSRKIDSLSEWNKCWVRLVRDPGSKYLDEISLEIFSTHKTHIIKAYHMSNLQSIQELPESCEIHLDFGMQGKEVLLCETNANLGQWAQCLRTNLVEIDQSQKFYDNDLVFGNNDLVTDRPQEQGKEVFAENSIKFGTDGFHYEYGNDEILGPEDKSNDTLEKMTKENQRLKDEIRRLNENSKEELKFKSKFNELQSEYNRLQTVVSEQEKQIKQKQIEDIGMSTPINSRRRSSIVSNAAEFESTVSQTMEGLQELLDSKFESIKKQLHDQSSKSNPTTQEDLVEKFSNSLSCSIGKEISSMQSTVTQLYKLLETMNSPVDVTALNSSLDNISHKIDIMAKSQPSENTYASPSKVIEKLSPISEALTGVKVYLAEIAELQNKSEEIFNQKLDKISQSQQKISLPENNSGSEIDRKLVSESIKNTNSSLDRISGELDKLNFNASTSSDIIKDTQSIVCQVLELQKSKPEISPDSSKLFQDVENMSKLLQSLSDKIDGQDRSLDKLFEKVSETLSKSVSKIEATSKTYSSSSIDLGQLDILSRISRPASPDRSRPSSSSSRTMYGFDTFTVVNHLLEVQKSLSAMRHQISDLELHTVTSKNVKKLLPTENDMSVSENVLSAVADLKKLIETRPESSIDAKGSGTALELRGQIDVLSQWLQEKKTEKSQMEKEINLLMQDHQTKTEAHKQLLAKINDLQDKFEKELKMYEDTKLKNEQLEKEVNGRLALIDEVDSALLMKKHTKVNSNGASRNASRASSLASARSDKKNSISN